MVHPAHAAGLERRGIADGDFAGVPAVLDGAVVRPAHAADSDSGSVAAADATVEGATRDGAGVGSADAAGDDATAAGGYGTLHVQVLHRAAGADGVEQARDG